MVGRGKCLAGTATAFFVGTIEHTRLTDSLLLLLLNYLSEGLEILVGRSAVDNDELSIDPEVRRSYGLNFTC
jgi:hypothetical protein